jgi:AcrR family transcriptional regulator
MPTAVATKTPKTARGQKTRRAILAAAEKVIGRDGFAAASISEITREAQVGQGTLYIYFKSKDDIFRELVLEMGRMVRHAMSEAVVGAGDRLEVEGEGLKAFLKFVAAHPNLYRVIQQAMFVAPDAYRAYFETFANGYREALLRAESAKEISPGDAEVRAWALMGVAKSLGERLVVFGATQAIDETVDAAADLIRNGLRP